MFCRKLQARLRMISMLFTTLSDLDTDVGNPSTAKESPVRFGDHMFNSSLRLHCLRNAKSAVRFSATFCGNLNESSNSRLLKWLSWDLGSKPSNPPFRFCNPSNSHASDKVVESCLMEIARWGEPGRHNLITSLQPPVLRPSRPPIVPLGAALRCLGGPRKAIHPPPAPHASKKLASEISQATPQVMEIVGEARCGSSHSVTALTCSHIRDTALARASCCGR